MAGSMVVKSAKQMVERKVETTAEKMDERKVASMAVPTAGLRVN